MGAPGRYTGTMSQLPLTHMPSTYAIGDLHGEVTLLRQLPGLLPLQPKDTVVFLGDYLDRGEDSSTTIATLRAFAQTHALVVFLRGNHEDAWLTSWDGVRFSRVPDMNGARKVWEDFGGKIPVEVGQWLAGTVIEYEDEHAYYVHAGVIPGRPVWRTPGVLKLWGQGAFWRAHTTGVSQWYLGTGKCRSRCFSPTRSGLILAPTRRAF